MCHEGGSFLILLLYPPLELDPNISVFVKFCIKKNVSGGGGGGEEAVLALFTLKYWTNLRFRGMFPSEFALYYKSVSLSWTFLSSH